MAELEKLLSTDSKVESLKKINAIIEKSGGINDKITNCLLEVPQRIKYTLNNGTLTIKAGSVVIVPYGTEDLTADYPVGSTFINDNFKVYDTQFADGKFFVWAEVQRDVSQNAPETVVYTRHVAMDITNNTLERFSGTVSGDSSIAPNTWDMFYRTDLNQVGLTGANKEILQQGDISLPFMAVLGDGTNSYGSIINVFNGMGYIGSTVWVDKGVRALLTNGRNEDGTLNNIDYINDKLVLRNGINIGDRALIFTPYRTGYPITSIGSRELYGAKYDEKTNSYPGYSGAWFATAITNSNGVITSFQPKQPVRLVDYNELQEVQCVVETYVNGTSGYRIWSDGYCEQWGRVFVEHGSSATVTLLKNYCNTNYSIQHSSIATSVNNDPGDTSVTSLSTSNFVIKTYETAGNFCWETRGYLA